MAGLAGGLGGAGRDRNTNRAATISTQAPGRTQNRQDDRAPVPRHAAAIPGSVRQYPGGQEWTGSLVCMCSM
jgi:hypothetical protein